MNIQRRTLIRAGAGALGLAILWPLRALADLAGLQTAFKSKTLDEAFKELGGKPTLSTDILLTTPDIAENGAVVPVAIVSKIPKTEQIMVMVEKNPNPMSAAFMIPADTDPSISTRVKVGQTCKVYAVVRADGKLYMASRETKVTLGGCGG